MKIVFLKNHWHILLVRQTKSLFFGPPKSSALDENVSIKCTLIYDFSVLKIYSAYIASESDVSASLTAHFSALYLDYSYLSNNYHGQ